MKWQGNNEKAAQRVNGLIIRVMNNRSLLVLAALAAVIVAATASFKWGGP